MIRDKLKGAGTVSNFAQPATFDGNSLGPMGPGCLVNVTIPSSGGDSVTIGYLVAEQDKDRAVEMIKRKLSQLTIDAVVVSRVSEELLEVLGVPPGEFRRLDGKPFQRQTDRGDAHEADHTVYRNPPRQIAAP